MKFLTKTNRNFFKLLISILIISTIAGYFLLHLIVVNEAKEDLLNKEFLVKKQIAETGEIPNLFPIVEVKKISKITTERPSFKTTFIQDELEDELETFIEYTNQVKIKDSLYLIILRQSTFENEDLVIVLALTVFILLLFTFGITFFVNKKMNKTIWTDFEHNLHEIENFSFSQNKNLDLLASNIEEFDRLNRVINDLTKKLTTDYRTLKEFTENAAHEIQTPMSVVLLNLEEILQHEISKDTFQKVVSSINAIKRLSALNQSLILLTKIENKQFEKNNIISFKELVEQKLNEFSSLLETKKLNVRLNLEKGFFVSMNDHLAEFMINNLLSNAINHNIMGGKIEISIQEKELKICNTGEDNNLTDETIFQRFTKSNSKSFGLGLAIVKNICNSSKLEIHYKKNELHCFTIHTKY